MLKYLICFFMLPSIVYAANNYGEIFWNTFVAAGALGLVIIVGGELINSILKNMTKRKMLVIALYIGFFVCCQFVLKERNIFGVGLIYMSIGCIGLILYNNYRSLYNTLINYVFVLYEFMLLLFVSNRSWRYEILNSQYDDNDMCIFIFLLFSSPTILYVAYNFFQKQKIDND